ARPGSGLQARQLLLPWRRNLRARPDRKGLLNRRWPPGSILARNEGAQPKRTQPTRRICAEGPPPVRARQTGPRGLHQRVRMRLGFFGDVVGRAGRAAVAEHLPRVRKQLKLDFVVVNGENSAGGFGITSSTANDLFDAGADCITLGNHSWDQAEALTFIE